MHLGFTAAGSLNFSYLIKVRRWRVVMRSTNESHGLLSFVTARVIYIKTINEEIV